MTKDKYSINSSKFYKIWFSNNPDVFLSKNNKDRFKNFIKSAREDQEIYFIYSSRSLSDKSIEELNSFCKEYKVTAIDFDNSFANMGDDLDQNLHKLASDELDLWLGNKGGNPAVASDLLRWSKYIINTYGIYSDFDVSINAQLLTSKMKTEQPILFSTCSAGLNNDFMAFAYDEESGGMHLKANQLVIRFQEDILSRLTDLRASIIKEDCIVSKVNDKYQKFVEIFLSKKSEDATIQDFRQFLTEIENKEVYEMSVTNIAGPGALNRILPMLIEESGDSIGDVRLCCSIERFERLNEIGGFYYGLGGDKSWLNGLLDDKRGVLGGDWSWLNDIPDDEDYLALESPADGGNILMMPTYNSGTSNIALIKDAAEVPSDNMEGLFINDVLSVNIIIGGARAIYDPIKENLYKLSYDLSLASSLYSDASPMMHSLNLLLLAPNVVNSAFNGDYYNAGYMIAQNILLNKMLANIVSSDLLPISPMEIGGTIALFFVYNNIQTLYNQYTDEEYSSVAKEHREEAIDYIQKTLCSITGNQLTFCEEL